MKPRNSHHNSKKIVKNPTLENQSWWLLLKSINTSSQMAQCLATGEEEEGAWKEMLLWSWTTPWILLFMIFPSLEDTMIMKIRKHFQALFSFSDSASVCTVGRRHQCKLAFLFRSSVTTTCYYPWCREPALFKRKISQSGNQCVWNAIKRNSKPELSACNLKKIPRKLDSWKNSDVLNWG